MCRRHHLYGDEREEFDSYVKLKLVERGAAILGSFEGRSTIETYLAVIVERLFLDYRAESWGRFRPSPVARRLGPVAIRLESLIECDGLAPAEAVRAVRVRHQVKETEDQLHALVAQLPPRRTRRRPEVPIDGDPAAEPEADPVIAGEERATAERLEVALDGALAQLPEQDRLIVRLHFLEGVTVASVAALLRLPSKPLYRRIERILSSLRTSLERSGIDAGSVAALIGRAEFGVGIRWVGPPQPGNRGRPVTLRCGHGRGAK